MKNKSVEGQLLYVLRELGGVATAPEITCQLKKLRNTTPTPGSLYAALNRLQTNKLLTSELSESSKRRGGRKTLIWKLTDTGSAALTLWVSDNIRFWRQAVVDYDAGRY